MSLISVGTITENLTVTDVWEAHLELDALPAVIFGRRATYDELIYDADVGFTQNWAGFSSITPVESGGFTLILGRRAYSMAGLAVFVGTGAGGGDGDATVVHYTDGGDLIETEGLGAQVRSIRGVPLDVTGTDGQLLGLVGGELVMVDPSEAGGGGDVVGPSSSVDARLAAFDGTTGKLLKDSGVKVSDFSASFAAVAALSAPPKYSGKTLSSVTLAGTSWTDFTSLCTWTDVVQDRITRSGASLTFAVAGTYLLMFDLNQATDGTTAHYVAFRARIGTTTILSKIHYHNAASTATELIPMNGLITVTAGQVVTIQCARSAGGLGTWVPGTIDGDSVMATGNLSICQIST